MVQSSSSTSQTTTFDASKQHSLSWLDDHSSIDTSESSFHVRDPKPLLVAASPPPVLTSRVTSPMCRRKKSVRFNPTVRTQEVLHRLDMERDLKRDTWYLKKELKAIQKECRQVVRQIQSENLTEDTNDGVCILGLVRESYPYVSQRVIHKATIRQVVFQEQERQRTAGVYNSAALAAKCMSFASRCHQATFVTRQVMERTTKLDCTT